MTTSNDLIQTKKAYIKEAKRFLANGKETIAKSPIDGKLYADEKYVREGAGIAYLAALKAMDGYLIGLGVASDQLPKSIDEYWAMKKKYIPHNGKFTQSLTIAYQHLHIATYYRGVTTLSVIKEGLQAVKEIIAMLEDG
jgi:hypothetical protein